MQPAPKDWPRISSCLTYQDAGKAIDWLCGAFGFTVRLKVEGEDGAIEHSELVCGDGVIMVGDERVTGGASAHMRRSPRSAGGANTQNLFMYVDDVVAHCERARGAGAAILAEPKVNDYGADHWVDQSYECADLEGHRWWFAQRLRTGAAT